MRRAKIKHHGLFTRNTVWRNWENLPLLEEGILLRIERLAKRRGKSKTWVTKRFNRDIKRYRNYQSDQAARLKEIFEEMQKGLLGEHDHEHDATGTESDTDT
jgi:predicted transcriptional regulator